MAYHKLKEDTSLKKIRTKDNDIKELKNITEKHEKENFSKSIKIDINSHRKKHKCKKNEKLLISSKSFIGSCSTFVYSSKSTVNLSSVTPMASSSCLITRIAILITIE